jgi:cytochrome P450
MTDILTAEDAFYEELYDVRNEAEQVGNLLDEDIYPPLNALRDRAPVHKGYLRDLLELPIHYRFPMSEGREGYTCFDFDSCNAAFRDHERFSSRIVHHPVPSGERSLGMLEMDEPEHRAYRNTMQSMFLKPKTMTWWRDRWINSIVQTLIENLAGRDRAELNLQLCARLPVHTITRAVGMNGDNALIFRQALIRSRLPKSTPTERAHYGGIVEDMLLSLIAQRRAEPEDDLVSFMLRSEFVEPGGAKRPLTDREILIHVSLVMLAGGGTSWRQFGITLWALLTHPEQYAAAKADRSLIDKAIDESLRWNPTDPVFSRLVVSDANLGGIHIPAGSVLDICLGAANRDPSYWENPNAYDLHRERKSHLGFGMGVHQCMGMNVAKSEINVGLNALFDAFPNMRLDPDAAAPHMTGGLEQRGMSAIPVLLR